MADTADEKKSASAWQNQLTLSKKADEKWCERSRKIVKRYRDERGNDNGEVRYNILWSNVRTMFPAVYARKPQAQVERRFKDADPVGRVAAEIVERVLQFEIDQCGDYDSAIRGAILDRLLPGRGVAWVRFEPGSQIAAQITDDTPKDNAQPELAIQTVETPEVDAVAVEGYSGRDYDYSPVDYVFWEDFRHSPARTWEEVTWVARRVYMSQDEGVARFGDDFKLVPRAHEPIGMDELKSEMANSTETDAMKKAEVWEIWDKATHKVYWIAKDWPNLLDEKDDPLELDEFFPCPKPLFATTTTDTLTPVPDYIEYQDQARELDILTQRISMLVKACKVVGVYDASATGIQRMLTDGVDNELIPVDNWAAFAEKGGVKGQIDWIPLDNVVQALNQLYMAREQVKQIIYEVTGLSDILRGTTMASETATAQQIKSNFASLRLKETITDVARFASDLLRIKGQMICNFYSPESLVEISGIMGTQDAQFAPQAIELLKSGPSRNYRIEVAADSMVELDEQAEKASRLEFLQAAGTFLDKAVQGSMAVPELAPLLGEMLMFGVRSFKGGRSMENAFEQTVQRLSQPQPQKPDPAQQQAQAEQQRVQLESQTKLQIHQMTLQAEAQNKQAQAQVDMQLQQAELASKERIEEMKIMAEARNKQAEAMVGMETDQRNIDAMGQIELIKNMTDVEFLRWKEELGAATKIEVANIGAKVKMDTAATQAATSEIASEVKQ